VLDHVIADQFADTRDYAEVRRRLWDSWEDNAEIRDAAGGRFIDLGSASDGSIRPCRVT
jgi:hypothetical protein